MSLTKTTKGAFAFPTYGTGRYIPDAEFVSCDSRIRWDTQNLDTGKAVTVDLATGSFSFTTSQAWLISYPYRVTNITVATECHTGKTMANVADLKAELAYGSKLAKLETWYENDGIPGRVQWGSGFVITGTSIASVTGSKGGQGILRLVINCEYNERAKWLAYAVYRKEVSEGGIVDVSGFPITVPAAFAQSADWDTYENSGLV